MISLKSKINTSLIIDINICVFYILLSMMALKFILPDGDTTHFLNRGYTLVSSILFLLIIILVIFWLIDKSYKVKKRFNLPKINDFYLLALPMSPVCGYLILNTEYLNFIGIIYLLMITLIFCLFFCFIIPILLSYFGSFNALMISGLSFSFTILNMPLITENPNNHFFNSLFVTQGLYLIISFLILYLIYSLNKKIAYTITIVFFLTGIVQNLFIYFSKKDTFSTIFQNRLEIFLQNENNKIVKKNNIYILVYESYANLETLDYYGFDNSKQINFLENNNFKIYHGAYSNGGLSIPSTSRVLEISGKLDKDGRHYLSGNAFGLEIFKQNGYETIGLFKSPYFFGTSPITWDEYYPKANINEIGAKTILKAIYQGYFRFDIFEDNYDYSKYLNLKNKYLENIPTQPRLFYTHNGYPGHSTDRGKCRPDEKQRYFKRLKTANLEMKNDINNIKQNDPNSLIVLLSDHGPYLTKNCTSLRGYKKNTINRYDIQDRYGTFLAINWPKNYNSNNYNIEIIQDIFPSILSQITNNDKLFEELKVERKFFDRFETKTGNINVSNGILVGGKDDGKPLFEKRSYKLPN